jgi:hypothetical protein
MTDAALGGGPVCRSLQEAGSSPPTRKAKVEVAVLIIERWLLGRLRHRPFYSLAELNAAIGELLRQLNDK